MRAKSPASSPRQPHLPGEAGVWLVVIGDLFIFLLMFSLFLAHVAIDRTEVAAARGELDQGLALLNTALMLSSSWFVAHAVRAGRSGRADLIPRWLGGAAACGVGFGLVKAVEWHAKIAHGIFPTTNGFFGYYFVLTGIHLVHVLIATVILLLIARLNWRDHAVAERNQTHLESAATFWHLVDMVWIALLALLYLLP